MPIDEKQITNRQHAVPQNIMEVEFKIIGEMTLREFIYLAVFGALAYFSAMTVGNLLKWPMVFFFGGVGLIFAFLPINDRGMDEWVANFLRAIYNPTQKVWRKTPEIPKAFTFENLAFVRNELITLAPTTTRRKLENYLDSYNQEEEQKEDYEKKEEEFIKKVRDTYAYYKMEEKSHPYTVQVPDVPVLPNVETELLPSQLPKPVVVNMQSAKNVIPRGGQEAQADAHIESAVPALSFDIKAVFKQMQQPATNAQPAKDTSAQTPAPAPVQPVKEEKKSAPSAEEIVLPTPQKVEVQEGQQTSPVMQRLLDQISKTKQEQNIVQEVPNKEIARIEAVKNRLDPIDRQHQGETNLKEVKAKTYPKINLLREFSLAESNRPLTPSITPDRVAGRMFTPLALNNEGEIILPIRGERVLKVNNQNEVDIELQLEEKTKQLQQFLDQIRMESGTLPKKGAREPLSQEAAASDPQRTEENIKKLQAENQKLIEEMAKVKVEMAKASQVKTNFEQQEQIIGSAKIEQEVLLNRITELQKRLEEQTKKQKEEERLREEKRIEEERKQEETLRLMIKMQKDKEAPLPGQTFAPQQEAKKPTVPQAPEKKPATQTQPAPAAQTPLHASLATPETPKGMDKTLDLNSSTPKEVVLPKPTAPTPVPIAPPTFGKQMLTNSPNVITGLVKNSTGNVLDNVLVIIKRTTGEPVRALKTNKLGVFAITTPLGDGEYIVELDKANHTGLVFEATKVVLDGKVLPPLEFIGKQNV